MILEDNLETLSNLLMGLTKLENELEQKISVTVFSEFWQVEEHLNRSGKEKFDFVLLDRDCKLGGSFHILDLDKYSHSVIIGISSVPRYNQELAAKGVKNIVGKDYNDLANFTDRVMSLIRSNVTGNA